MAKLRVVVLFGGRSGEHEVSIRSAASVVAGFDRERYAVIPVAIDRRGRFLAPEASAALLPEPTRQNLETSVRLDWRPQPDPERPVDVVFPVLHGTFGEDGTVQGLLELADIAYVGSGVLGSACGMDKDVMKRLFREAGLPTVEHLALRRDEVDARADEAAARFGYPVFVKPANLGSSVGVARAGERDELLAALRDAARYDAKLVVERAVAGREIEVAVLGNDEPEASVPGEIAPAGGFYDYESKYLSDTAELRVPAPLKAADSDRARRLAVDAFRTVGCRGLARVDFFLETSTGRLLLNEVNTMPGFTSISMYPKLWEASGLPFPRLLGRLVDLALEAHAVKRSLRFER